MTDCEHDWMPHHYKHTVGPYTKNSILQSVICHKCGKVKEINRK